MSVEGFLRVSIDLNDTHTEDSIDSLKKVALSSSNAYTNGIIAVASGTCGTTAETIDISNFRGADGELVDFGPISGLDDSLRICFLATPAASLRFLDTSITRGTFLHSVNDKPSVSFLARYPEGTPQFFVGTQQQPEEPSYTASYTLVIMKEA